MILRNVGHLRRIAPVTTALHPFCSTSFASSLPKPVEQPVMNQTGSTRFIMRYDSEVMGCFDEIQSKQSYASVCIAA